MSTRNTLTAFK